MAVIWRMRQGIGSRTGRAVRALICIAIALVAADILVGRYGAVRLDLTSEHLYTLARGTRQTLARIEEPITLRFYYSSKLGDASPGYGVYAQRVRELLDQYVAAARGKIRLEVYDPLPFTDAEDRAVGYGLQAVPLNDQGEAVYFGLAGTNSTDDQQTVAFFNPERERFLEYDLTRLVHALAFPKRTIVGVMSPLPIDVDLMAAVHGRAGEPMPIIDQLRQVDDVQSVPLTAETIPANIDVLLLVHPQKLTDATQFAIDQFVLRGGKALVFVDPYSEIQAALAQANPDTAAGGSDLERLFTAWGLKMLPDVVAGDRRRARRVGVPVANRGSQAMDYVGWLNLQAEDLSRDDPITADLTQITMATAGILQPIEGATTAFAPLIQTSTDFGENPGREGERPARCRRAARWVQAGAAALHAGRAYLRQRGDGISRRRAAGGGSETGRAVGPAGAPRPRRSNNRSSRSTSSSSPTPICSTTGSGRSRAISSAAKWWCRSPTTAISSPMRSRCWPAARTSSICAAAAPWRGRSRWSSASSARPTNAMPPSSAASKTN